MLRLMRQSPVPELCAPRPHFQTLDELHLPILDVHFVDFEADAQAQVAPESEPGTTTRNRPPHIHLRPAGPNLAL